MSVFTTSVLLTYVVGTVNAILVADTKTFCAEQKRDYRFGILK
jgi:hypothetical protein